MVGTTIVGGLWALATDPADQCEPALAQRLAERAPQTDYSYSAEGTIQPATMAAVLVVTACTATPTVTVGPTIGPPTAPPSETAAETDASDPTPEPPSPEPSLASPTLRSHPALAELIPDEVKGRILRKKSIRGEEAVATLFPEDDHAIMRVFLQELGASFEDYSYARGWYGSEPNERGGISIVAMRVRGADPDALLREVMLHWSRESDPGRISTRTMGGKDVTAMELRDRPGALPAHFYSRGDIVFTVNGSRLELIEASVAGLP